MEIRSWLDGILHPSRNYQSTEARAIYFAVFAGTLSLIATLFYFWGRETIPIFGKVSIGATAIVQSSITAIIGYFFVLYQNRDCPPEQSMMTRLRAYFDMAALSFIHGAIAFLLTTIVFFVVSQGFRGVQIDVFASSFIVAATVLVTGYAFYLIAENATTLMISSALAVFLVAGALTSMFTSTEPYWWQQHLSSLGGGTGISSYAFNVTLIIGGIVIISIADLIAKDFAQLSILDPVYQRANVGIVRAIIVVMGIFLAGIGLFPWNTHPLLHNISSTGMMLLFVCMVACLRSLVPTFSNAFFVFSYALIGVLVASLLLLLRVGYFDLTAFEMICFLVLFGWFVVFVRQVAAALHDEKRRIRV